MVWESLGMNTLASCCTADIARGTSLMGFVLMLNNKLVGFPRPTAVETAHLGSMSVRACHTEN